MNSAYVRRMMQNLTASIRDQPTAAEAPPEVKAPRRKKAEPEHISPESSDSDSGSESEYEEVNKIKSYFESEPCESISPAALSQATTTKEAVQYLKSKKCPKIANIKKGAKSIKMDNGPPAPGPETAPTRKRVPKPKAVAAPATAIAAAPPAPAPPAPVAAAPEAPVKKARAKKAAAPAPAPAPAPAAPAAAAPAAKAKRAPSAYAALVGKLVKEKKMSFAEAAKAAKAELDAKKKQ
jgi:hypothetical protein